jgi:hypothetical protein
MSHFTMIDEIKRLEKENAENLLLIEKLKQERDKWQRDANEWLTAHTSRCIEINELNQKLLDTASSLRRCEARIKKALETLKKFHQNELAYTNRKAFTLATTIIEILEGKITDSAAAVVREGKDK